MKISKVLLRTITKVPTTPLLVQTLKRSFMISNRTTITPTFFSRQKSNFASDNKDGSTTNYIREMKDIEEWNALVDNKDYPRPVVVQCSTSWCRPCQVLKPLLSNAIKQKQGKVEFLYADIEQFPDLAEGLGVCH